MLLTNYDIGKNNIPIIENLFNLKLTLIVFFETLV